MATKITKLLMKQDGKWIPIIPEDVSEVVKQCKDLGKTDAIILEDSIPFYSKRIRENTEFTIDSSQLHITSTSNKILQFRLFVIMSQIKTLSWGPNIVWVDGIQPSFDDIASYLIVFTSYNNGYLWIAELEKKWTIGSPIDVTSIEINNSQTTLIKSLVKSTEQFTATILPVSATIQIIEWTSSDESVLSINSSTGLGRLLKAGNVTISAASTDGTELVTSKDFIVLQGIEFLQINGEIPFETSTMGQTYELNVTILPNDAFDKRIIWSSSDETAATVDPVTGLVTIVHGGGFTIYATAQDGSGVVAQKRFVAYGDLDEQLEQLKIKVDNMNDKTQNLTNEGFAANPLNFVIEKSADFGPKGNVGSPVKTVSYDMSEDKTVYVVGCNASCASLCVSSCTNGCAGGCNITCTGGCTSCSGCTGCSSCSGGCVNSCSGCTGSCKGGSA